MAGMTVTQKLVALGIGVPVTTAPLGAYVRAKRAGGLVFTAGQLPMRDGKLTAAGVVPGRCPVEQAAEGARLCVINALGAAGSVVPLDRLTGVVRVGVFVASEPDFYEQPRVANGASELLVEVFGEAGRHVRTACGVNVLPMNSAVE